MIQEVANCIGVDVDYKKDIKFIARTGEKKDDRIHVHFL